MLPLTVQVTVGHPGFGTLTEPETLVPLDVNDHVALVVSVHVPVMLSTETGLTQAPGDPQPGCPKHNKDAPKPVRNNVLNNRIMTLLSFPN